MLFLQFLLADKNWILWIKVFPDFAFTKESSPPPPLGIDSLFYPCSNKDPPPPYARERYSLVMEEAQPFLWCTKCVQAFVTDTLSSDTSTREFIKTSPEEWKIVLPSGVAQPGPAPALAEYAW